jgi:NAD(P)-dependent dehydrogenase (short-subunit alcohol dehydrogenase family)
VVFTGSSEGRQPRAYWGAYAISKSAVESLSQVLADEMQNLHRVRVNVFNPGPVRTRLRRQAFPAEELGALPEPQMIVQPYLWLLGPASRGVSGQSLG